MTIYQNSITIFVLFIRIELCEFSNVPFVRPMMKNTMGYDGVKQNTFISSMKPCGICFFHAIKKSTHLKKI